MIKKTIHIIIIMVLVGQTSIYAQSIEQLKKERKQIQSKLEQTTKQIKETQKNEKQSLKKINVIKQGVIERKALINNYSAEVNILEKKIGKLTNETENLQKELSKLKKDYTRLIQKAQANQNVHSKLMFVLSAKNFDQSMRRVRYLHEYTAFQKQQGNKIKKTQQLLEQKTDSLGKHKTSKVQIIKTKENEAVKLQKDQKTEQTVLKDLQKQEKKLTSEYQKQQQKVNEINNKIERIIAEEIRKTEERKKAEEARRKAADVARQKALAEQRRKAEEEKKRNESTNASSSKKTTTTKNTETTAETKKEENTLSTYEISKETREENLLSGNFERNQGRLPWPVDRGSVSGHFGVRPHPVFKHVTVNNKGTYFQSPSGTNARAVYEGVVKQVFSISGSGNAIIVEHGKYFSVYGNLSNVYVKTGQKVTAKQSIGKIYSDDETGKTELYFQIYQGRQLLNPESWIAR